MPAPKVARFKVLNSKNRTEGKRIMISIRRLPRHNSAAVLRTNFAMRMDGYSKGHRGVHPNRTKRARPKTAVRIPEADRFGIHLLNQLMTRLLRALARLCLDSFRILANRRSNAVRIALLVAIP